MDPTLYEYPSPLEGWENHEPLSDERNEDGKSLKNPTPTTQSPAYNAFPSPITNDIRGGFDIHIYFLQTNPSELEFAKSLHSRIRLEFPELRIYQVWEKPIGPHPVGMFEVNIFTPQQFGAFIPWLRATWMGMPYPLQTGMLREVGRRKKEEKEKGNL
ncbi:putative 21.2 kDa protein, partial [Pseudocercospora fuligena]